MEGRHLFHSQLALVCLYRKVQRFRDGLVFKAHGLCVSLNSRLESNKGMAGRHLFHPQLALDSEPSVRVHEGVRRPEPLAKFP